jgi:hypothetical protein
MRLVQLNTEEEHLGNGIKLWFTINFPVKYHYLLSAIRKNHGQVRKTCTNTCRLSFLLQNGHNVSIVFRETHSEDNRRIESTTVEVVGAEADVRRMMAKIRRAGPLTCVSHQKNTCISAPGVEELTKIEHENYYAWLTCPHNLSENMRCLEVGQTPDEQNTFAPFRRRLELASQRTCARRKSKLLATRRIFVT